MVQGRWRTWGLLLGLLASSVGCGNEASLSGGPGATAEPERSAPDRSAQGQAAPGADSDGGKTPSEAGPSSARPEPSGLQSPPAPQRVFDPSRRPLGPWFDELAKRFSAGPDGDDWPTEVIGPYVERRLTAALRAQGREGTPLPVADLAKRWSRWTQLVPTDAEILRDSGSLRVTRGREFPEGPAAEAPSGFQQALADLVKPVGGPGMDAEVQVIACSQLERARFEALALVRLWNVDGPSAIQINLRCRTEWRARGQVLLAGFEGLVHERVELDTNPFAELTRHVVPEHVLPDRHLLAGGVEFATRHDRAIPSTNVYLGMHGLGVGDLDGDGLEDVYVARQGGLPNHLFLHQPGGRVVDAASAAGLDFLDDTCGVLVCDLDGDGARDLALGVGPVLLICWNDGKAGFRERTALRRPRGAQVYSITAADPDGDGDLDLYDTRYFAGTRAGGAPTPYHDAMNGAPNSFWRQTEPRVFEEATSDVGLDAGNDRFSLAALWEDLDSDGDLDLYVTNDFGRNNLYRNDGGQFHDAAEGSGAMDMAAGMGISVADVELDGDLDLYVSNMHSPAGERVIAHPRFQKTSPIQVRAAYQDHARGNSLLLGNGDGTFQRARGQGVAGTGPGGWAWGAVFCDFDGDGYSDIVVPNGFATGRLEPDLDSFFWRVVVGSSPTGAKPTDAYLAAWQAISHMSQVIGLSWNGRERNYGYWNLGGGEFVDASAVARLDFADDGRVVSPCDWDLDGRLDLWVKNRTAPTLRFLHGRLPLNPSWIAVELRGSAPNTEAVGASVTVELASGARRQARVHAGFGYLGSPSKRLRFAVPADDSVEGVSVQWPDGQRTTTAGLAVGALYRLDASGAAERVNPPASSLGAAPHQPIAAGVRPQVRRVPALTSLPLGPLLLPDAEGPSRPVASFAGQPLLVVLWGSWEPAALALFERLAQELPGEELAVWPVSLDKGRHWKAAASALGATGLPSIGGRSDLRTRKLFELAVAEVIGSFDDLPLPLGFLIDSSGHLVCLYFGPPTMPELRADLAALRTEESRPMRRVLAGGTWALEPPRRRFETLSDMLEKAGESELARALREAGQR